VIARLLRVEVTPDRIDAIVSRYREFVLTTLGGAATVTS
jgi:hypothetical protein